MARAAPGAVRPAADRPGLLCPALRTGDLRGAEGLPSAGRFHRHLPTGQERRADPLLGTPHGDAGATRGALPGVSEADRRRRLRLGPRRGWRGGAVPAPLHDLQGGGTRRPPGQQLQLLRHRLPGRRLLQGRHHPGQRVAVDRVRPRGPRRHRCRKVRGQLRRLAGSPVLRRGEGLRPGRVAGRRRAHLDRGDGRDEPCVHPAGRL